MTALLRTTLILLGLLPIGLWVFLANALVDTYELGLILMVILFTPALIGGVLMVACGGSLVRKPWTARFMASLGIVIMLVYGFGALFFAPDLPRLFWAEAPPAVTLIAYILVHCGLIAWLWRSFSGEDEPTREQSW